MMRVGKENTHFEGLFFTGVKTTRIFCRPTCRARKPLRRDTFLQRTSHFLGKPKAIRAVASANGHNRIGIIIPCHRIVGSDGSLKSHGGGLHRKQWLLDFEKKHSG